jgi:hypothetical protein
MKFLILVLATLLSLFSSFAVNNVFYSDYILPTVSFSSWLIFAITGIAALSIRNQSDIKKHNPWITWIFIFSFIGTSIPAVIAYFTFTKSRFEQYIIDKEFNTEWPGPQRLQLTGMNGEKIEILLLSRGFTLKGINILNKKSPGNSLCLHEQFNDFGKIVIEISEDLICNIPNH